MAEKEEEEKKPRKRFRLSSEMIQSIREVKLGIKNAKDRYKNYKEDPKKAKAHAEKIAKLNKPRAKKPEWSETKAGKEHAKKMKKLTDAAKRKAKLARMRKHLKAVQKQRKDNKPLKKQYTPSKSGLGINNK